MTTQPRDLRQEWETPQDFFDVVDREFGFTLDAAATKMNAKCERFISPENDAFGDTLWRGYLSEAQGYEYLSVWLNPGFSKMGSWLERVYHEINDEPFQQSVGVVMSLVSPSAKWWRNWAMKASEIRLLGGKRVQFVAPEGVKQSSNARENCLIIFRPNPYSLPPRIWTWDWTFKKEEA